MKKLIKNPLVILLTVIAGIAAAVLIHQNTWFKFEPTRAEIPMTSEIQANLTYTATSSTDIGLDEEGNSVVVWDSINGPDNDVFMSYFDATGTGTGTETRVNTTTSGDQYQSAIAMDEQGNYVIAWKGYNSSNATDDIFIQAFQPDGTAVGGETIVNTTTANEQWGPRIAIDYNGPSNSSRFVVGWNDTNSNEIYFQRFTADFTQTTNAPSPSGSETLVSGDLSGVQRITDIAMNNLGEFIIGGYHNPGSADIGIYRIYSQNGTALTNLLTLNDGTYKTLAVSVAADKKARSTLNDTADIRFIISYDRQLLAGTQKHIATRLVSCADPDDTNNSDTDLSCSISTEPVFDTQADTVNKSNPAVDADYLGNFTVVWEDESIDGDDYGIAGQSYNYKGQITSGLFQVNGTVDTDLQTYPRIAMNTDGFYDVVFRDYTTALVYFKKYVNEIFKVGDETLLHTGDTSTQSDVVTAISPTHNQVFVWMDDSTSPRSLKYTLLQINNSDPSNPTVTKLKDNQTIATGNNINFPDVDFFKDDTNCNRFIVVWENDLGGGNGKDIYYNIFDSAGTAEYGSPQALAATTDAEVAPAVAAGIYNNGVTDVKIFSAGWLNETDSSVESKYHLSGTFYPATVSSNCNGETCNNVKNSLNPNNNRVVFSYDTVNGETASNVFIQQLDSYTLVGNPVEVNSGSTFNNYSDIRFITDNDFAVVYTYGGDTLQGSRYIFDAISGGDGNQDPDLDENFSISQSYLSTLNQALNPRLDAYPTADANLQQFLVTWTQLHPDSSLHIFGQLLDYSGSSVIPFGPSFRINSSRSGDSYNSDVGYNRYGIGVVAWEGESSTDTWGVQYQLIQNPATMEEMAPLEPVCRQQISAGGLTMSAPTSIAFPDVSVSATDTEVQDISVRDATYGGDIKYVEVQDATGLDFTLSVQVSDFIADADGKTYMTADEHFKVKNWDGSTTGTNINCAAETPLNCFLTENSTYTPTAFSLSSETDEYAFADTQKVLATKTGTVQSEIGRWKIYPQFQITVPPIIPAGLHEATITFTLVN